MNHPDPLAAPLIGTWQCVRTPDSGGFTHFRITEDLKVFSADPYAFPPDGKVRHCQFRMLLENLTKYSFTLRFAGTAKGSPRRYAFEGGRLILWADTPDGERQWTCTRLEPPDFPEYLEPEYQKALERPWL